MNLIVACDQKYNIGKNGDLLTYLPEDLKRFKTITYGNVMIMGRKTIESLPGGRLLPGRETWILTRDTTYAKEGATIFHSVEAIVAHIHEANLDTSKIFVCGGAEIYTLFLPYCKQAYVTHIEKDFQGDVGIPSIEHQSGWYLAYRSEIKKQDCLQYYYATYVNRSYTQF